MSKPIRVLQVVPSLNRAAGVARFAYNMDLYHDEDRVHFDYLHHSSIDGLLMHDKTYDKELQEKVLEYILSTMPAEDYLALLKR